MMPADAQASLIGSMLQASNATNPQGVQMICGVLSTMMGNVTVTADNFTTLLPIMTLEQKYVALNGLAKSEQVPFDINGLITLTGDETMTGIYAYMSEQLKSMTVNEDIFLALLSS